MSKKFELIRQRDAMDCGPACLAMIAKYHGRHLRLEELRERCFITRTGVSLLGISEAAESLGLCTSYNQSLPTTLEAMGQAEVITSDKRLIERLLAPIYRLFSQNT